MSKQIKHITIKNRRKNNLHLLIRCTLAVTLIMGIYSIYQNSKILDSISELKEDELVMYSESYSEDLDNADSNISQLANETLLNLQHEDDKMIENIKNLKVEENVKKIEENVEKNIEEKKEDKKEANKNVQDVSYRKEIQPVKEFTDEDILLLARLINSEAGSESYNGKVAVGNVVRYRMKKLNKSLSDVIYQKGQFDGVKTKQFNETPSKECLKASYDVLINKTIVISNAYYYANLKICKKPNWATDSNFIMRIGNHWFYSLEK